MSKARLAVERVRRALWVLVLERLDDLIRVRVDVGLVQLCSCSSDSATSQLAMDAVLQGALDARRVVVAEVRPRNVRVGIYGFDHLTRWQAECHFGQEQEQKQRLGAGAADVVCCQLGSFVAERARDEHR
jgi:hypothetical protein